LNDFLVYCVSQKLDPSTRRAWKLSFKEDSPPATFEDLTRFIASRAQALGDIKPDKSTKPHENKVTSAAASSVPEPLCVLCKQRHFINKCPTFIEKSPSQRVEIVKQNKRCFNCLSTKHVLFDYKSRYLCQKKHHSMLHIDSLSSANTMLAIPSSEPSQPVEASQVNALSAISIGASPSPVLLATARVIVSSPAGRVQIVRALLDQESEVSFITESLAQMLQL